MCCRALGFRRQTYYRRKQGHRPEEVDEQIADILHHTTKRFIAWGFWLVFYFLRRKGHIWNHKRVYRVWKAEKLHLRLPARRAAIKRTYQELLSPDEINSGWAMDFVSDWTVGLTKEAARIINIIDEKSRRALWTEAYRSISAKTLIEVLDKVVEYRGRPKYIRCDNGPEFISQKLAQWAADNQIELKFIQPGKPSQNGLIERLNKTLRVECLNLHWFESLQKLNESIQAWSVDYNTERPHENLNRQTPLEYETANQDLYFKVVA
jgi:putative transposase